nr:low temperature requirement protein A [Quadrisphaera setariae]
MTGGHALQGVATYLLVFFAVWWAWMNFTWFATTFAVDDWLYRVLTVLQMAGVLVLAAGVEPVFDRGDLRLLVLGYVVMRVAMVAQWLRAARTAGRLRRTALTYAVGIAAVQVLWVGALVLHGTALWVAAGVLVVAELAVPVVAERRGNTTWHLHHITERYGLFTLILLGESLLGSANAIIEALHDEHALGALVSVSVLVLVSTAALWWVYFWPPHHRVITDLRSSLRYGYAHYAVFAAAGALSAGVETEISSMTGESGLRDLGTSLTVTVPVAVFLLGVWWVALRASADRTVRLAVPVAALLVLLDPLVPVPVTLTTVVLVLLVVVLVVHPPLSAPGAAARGAGSAEG